MHDFKEYIINSGLTIDSISKRTAIQFDRIHSIINGEDEPTMNEIRKISKSLKLPVDYLLSNNKYDEIKVLFRKGTTSKSEINKADRLSYTVGNVMGLLQNYKVSDAFFNAFPSLENTYDNARLLATLFRKFFFKNDFINPILDLPNIVVNELACMLFVLELGNNIDGASAIINNIPFIFISERFEPRMLFTLAHELAHVLSHLSKQEDYAKIDNKIATSKNSKFKDEAFANVFASQLLLPKQGVGITLKKIRALFKNTGSIGDIEIIYLSRIYGVSFDVAAKRCEDLDLLLPGGATALSREIKNEYGSAEKRAQELKIQDRPKVIFPKVSPFLVDSAIHKIKTGEMSIGKASELLSIPIEDILKSNAKS